MVVLVLISVNLVTTHVWLNQRLFGSLAMWCICFFSGFLLLLGCFCWLVIVLYFPIYIFSPCPLSCYDAICSAMMFKKIIQAACEEFIRWGLNKQLVNSFLQRDYFHFPVTKSFSRVLNCLVNLSIRKMCSGINSRIVQCKMSTF